VETSVRPVLMPIRIVRPEAAHVSLAAICHAAATARSASSSRATGNPNTDSTASPMNFSMTPPWASTASVQARK
jgi:hypothetical protein